MTDHRLTDPALLTISELARFAGVTVRAVRHYHARGLLPEPERDESGYRRYDAQAVIELIRIKALTDAGVPLARVTELLDAGPQEFAEAIVDIDQRLSEEVARLEEHRSRIARLAAGDSLALPREVVDYLDFLRQLGLSERTVRVERDGWILMAAHAPDDVVRFVEGKVQLFDDPAYGELYRTFDQSADWLPGDPRLEELADLLCDYAGQVPDDTPGLQEGHDEPLVTLLDAYTEGETPGWRHLRGLLEERGWTRWTPSRDAGGQS